MTTKVKVSRYTMDLILLAVERGFKDCERGCNLEGALLNVNNMFEIEKPEPREITPAFNPKGG